MQIKQGYKKAKSILHYIYRYDTSVCCCRDKKQVKILGCLSTRLLSANLSAAIPRRSLAKEGGSVHQEASLGVSDLNKFSALLFKKANINN